MAKPIAYSIASKEVKAIHWNEWQANDYELVRQTTNKQYDECLAQLKEDAKANTSKL